MDSKPNHLSASIIISTAALISLFLGVALSVATSNRIAQGVTVYGQIVGGMTRQEAKIILSSWETEALSRKLEIKARNKTWEVTPAQIGIRPNIEEGLRQAYAIGRTGPRITRWWVRMVPGPNRNVSPPVLFEKALIDRFLISVSKQVNTPHKDAKLEIRNGSFIVIPQSDGAVLDSKRALSLLQSGTIFESSVLVLPVNIDKPKVTTNDLRRVDTLLTSFTTRFPNARGDRAHNIRLASSALDGILLLPGEVLSYNQRVGPRLPRFGFREAPIYVNGQIESGPGGGICQVSTTLYNAALRSGLQIVSRDNHSMPVHYVSAGFDATVAYGSTDLKIRNNLKNPIYITLKTSSNTVTASIYGSASDKKKVRVFTSKRTPFPVGYTVKTFIDSKGVKKTVRVPSSYGFSVTVFREIESDGKKITEVVSRDRYRPVPEKPSPTQPPKPLVKPKPTARINQEPQAVNESQSESE